MFQFKSMIGSGTFSKVYKVSYSNGQCIAAIKSIEKRRLMKKIDQKHLKNEIKIMKSLHHLNITTLLGYLTDVDNHYLIMEHASGGDLCDYILNNGACKESNGKKIVASILNATDYIHSKGVAHRDLKLDNILLSGRCNFDIKIADFGLSTRVSGPRSLTTYCGTEGYMAPEILNGLKYDESVDMWSIGVIIYIIVTGYYPFASKNEYRNYFEMKKGENPLHKILIEKYISRACINLIDSLLTASTDIRFSASEALQHHTLQWNHSLSIDN